VKCARQNRFDFAHDFARKVRNFLRSCAGMHQSNGMILAMPKVAISKVQNADRRNAMPFIHANVISNSAPNECQVADFADTEIDPFMRIIGGS
jgi:hypothetical protein